MQTPLIQGTVVEYSSKLDTLAQMRMSGFWQRTSESKLT